MAIGALADAIEIWQIDCRAVGGSLMAWEASLDVIEAGRLSGLRHEDDRRRYLVAHGATRSILGGYLKQQPSRLAFDRACVACALPHGKPRLVGVPDPGLQFSLSHSGDMVVVAVTTARSVGVDIEAERPVSPHVDARTFAVEEMKILAGLDEPARAHLRLKAWTRKEAVVKATGEGMTRDLTEVAVIGAGGACALSGTELEGWNLADLEVGPGYVAAVAYSGPTVPIVPRSDPPP